MKLAKHLAIYIFLALNAVAGWHDSAPFVAWPATNNLRWVDNVGVYTNESAWTNAGYGAWTNNFLNTNLWNVTDFFGDYYIGATYFTGGFIFNDTVQSNMLLNAKDARSLDCANALLERHRVLSSSNTSSNFMNYAEGVFFYRSERDNIAFLKTWILNNLASFCYTTNGWTNAIAFTTNSLAGYASVPTNFLTYTPYRAADMSFTSSNGYTRIMTNTYTLRQGTNATHMATNNLVDSAGNAFKVVGTNGQFVTRIATNLQIQAGGVIQDYGFDGLRRVITSLVATVRTPTWGIGEGTNYTSSYSSNFTYTALNGFTAGTIGAVPDFAAIEAAATAANGNLPYYWNGVVPLDTWGWNLSDQLTSPTIYAKTNIAPYLTLKAAFDFQQDLASRHTGHAAFNGMEYLLDSDTWNVTLDTRNHSRMGTNLWDNYGAPLTLTSYYTNIDRALLLYAKTNTTQFLLESNLVAAGTASYTSMPFRLENPIMTNFGFYVTSSLSYFDGWNGVGTTEKPYIQSFLTAFGWMLSTSSSTNHPSASTNYPAPSVTADKAVEIWNFEYK